MSLRETLPWMIIIILAMMVFASSHESARGFASSQNFYKNDLPPGGTRGYFDDLELQARCYWIRRGDMLALSCLEK
jgi:hypothetical protein